MLDTNKHESKFMSVRATVELTNRRAILNYITKSDSDFKNVTYHRIVTEIRQFGNTQHEHWQKS